jgi:hypothetical protein
MFSHVDQPMAPGVSFHEPRPFCIPMKTHSSSNRLDFQSCSSVHRLLRFVLLLWYGRREKLGFGGEGKVGVHTQLCSDCRTTAYLSWSDIRYQTVSKAQEVAGLILFECDLS